MVDSSKIVRAITQLNRLTKEGILQWKDNNTYNHFEIGDKIISPVYEVTFEDQRIIMYKYSYKEYFEEYQYESITAIRLIMLNEAGRPSWEFPRDRSIEDLFKTVSFRTSNAESFINKLIKNDEHNGNKTIEEENNDLPF